MSFSIQQSGGKKGLAPAGTSPPLMGGGTRMLSSVDERRPLYADFDFGWNSTSQLYAEPIEVPRSPVTGRALIMAVEDFQNRLSARSLQQNPFWLAMVEQTRLCPE